MVHEVHLAELCEQVADALGLEAHPKEMEGAARTWYLGSYVRRPGERIPVYLGLPLLERDFRQAAVELIVAGKGPSVFLTPRSHHSETGTVDLIQRDGSVYLALSEILTRSDDGQLVARVQLADLFDERHEEAPTPEAFVFKKQGHFWEAAYQGDLCQLKDSNGLRYLQVLLRNPGREYLPEQLPTEAGESPPVAPVRLDERDSIPAPSGEIDPILDPQAAAEYKGRLKEVASELAEAEGRQDLATAEKLRMEREFLEDQLTQAFSLGGRPRTHRGPLQRTRDRVTKALRRSLDSIEKEHPAFFKHLDSSLKRKGTWAYCPEAEFPWVL